MYFQLLQTKLVSFTRAKIRSGELTERGLARIAGMSQPHVHNVLKGVRTLSAEAADQILRALRVTISDICTPEEMGGAMSSAIACRTCPVPVLKGRAGPGHPLPLFDQVDGMYPFPRALAGHLVNPVAVSLTTDSCMYPLFQERDLVLLDRSERARSAPNAETTYLVNTPEGALVRYIRLGGRSLYLLTHDNREDPRRWAYISLAERNILDIVRGRIVWIGRKMETIPAQPLKKAG